MTNLAHKVTVIGCGGWGSRIARKLAARGDVRLVLVDDDPRVRALANELGASWSTDPVGYLGVTGTAAGSNTPGAVVIATPPTNRRSIVDLVLDGYGVAPSLLRIEKPLAIDPADANYIVQRCADVGTQLTVGFTLLHHQQYHNVFEYVAQRGTPIVEVLGVRMGAYARHQISATVDLGAHVAGIAAYCDVPCRMLTMYADDITIRRTILRLSDDAEIIVDETNGATITPDGLMIDNGFDALDADLSAWLDGTHRGTPAVAVRATNLVWDELAMEVV